MKTMRLLLLIGVFAVVLRLGEATPCQAGETTYQMRTAAWGPDGWAAARFEPKTGKTWVMEKRTWVLISDAGPIEPGLYDVQIVCSNHPDQETFFLMRMNLETGKAWKMSGDDWVPMTDAAPEDAAK